MAIHAVRARAGRDRPSLYQEITDKIIAELEAGRVPWVQPWGSAVAKASLAMPKNAATQRQYSGINVLILWNAVIEHGFSTQNWLTFRQALRLAGNVRKGEHGTTVVYANRFVPDEERERAERDGDEPNTIPFLKRFTVFNTDQCEHLPADLTSAPAPVPDGLILPRAEALIATTSADFRIGGDRAFYSPTHDFIQVPRPEAYFEPINWHRTAVHELGHWTGHPSRLGRDLSGHFGSALYAKEELVAEMTSAFVCASLGIVPTVRHADYIGSWLDVLREDDRAIVRAASAASKAADYLLAFSPRHRRCLGSRDGCQLAGCDHRPGSMRPLSTKWSHRLRHFTLIPAKRGAQRSRRR
jgi:antirestriction protein ArdC